MIVTADFVCVLAAFPGNIKQLIRFAIFQIMTPSDPKIVPFWRFAFMILVALLCWKFTLTRANELIVVDHP